MNSQSLFYKVYKGLCLKQFSVYVFSAILLSGCIDESKDRGKERGTGGADDVTPPKLVEIEAIPSNVNTPAPTYKLIGTEDAALTFGGACAPFSPPLNIRGGKELSVTFAAMAEGTYNDCTIEATDDSGNVSLPLLIPAFTVDLTNPVITIVT